MKRSVLFFVLMGLAVCATTVSADLAKIHVRIGHFSNVTHAQALIGHADHRFDDALAPNAMIDWKIFNAGPSAVEAIFAGQLDIAYIGPSPAINAYVKSGTDAVRVVAGSAVGGAALVIRGDSGIKKVSDFHGKKIASPQLGNTQDVALRSWLLDNGLKSTDLGGDVQVLPLANPDQQTLFLKKEIDASWTVEPWVSIFLEKAGGKVFLEESSLWPGEQYSTALVLVRRRFLDEHPDLVKKFLQVHIEITHWIYEGPAHHAEAKKIIKAEIEKETGKEFPRSVLESAFARIHFSYDDPASSMTTQAKAAFKAGFLKKDPDISGLFDLKLLQQVLKEKKMEILKN